jgi:hypothetical protein
MSLMYQVRIRGRLSRTLTGEFEQLGLVANVAPVETVLQGPVVDQAALYGLIRRLEALGLDLVELRRSVGLDRAPPDQPGEPHEPAEPATLVGPATRPAPVPAEDDRRPA